MEQQIKKRLILGDTPTVSTTFVSIFRSVCIDVRHLKCVFLLVVTMGDLRNFGLHGNQYLKFGNMRNFHRKINEVSMYLFHHEVPIGTIFFIYS